MELAALIDALSDPAAYPELVEAVEVRQTHISLVFLAGRHVYKLKKPVALGFLDFSTLERQRHFCQEEVRLNRRLAPDVYLGVVPVVRTPDGRLRLEGEGEPIEWAVKMVRLPEAATLLSRLQRGELDCPTVERLARAVARFHATAVANEHTAAFGRFDVVAGNARENFTQSAWLIGTTVSRAVFDRLRERTESTLARLRPLIERRAERGAPRDTHGDLHLDHVYLFPDRPPPADFAVIDCIEFNERFRYADPVADAAFLVMDLRVHGERTLATAFAEEYFRAAGDSEGHELLQVYTAYRAAVRAKVEGFKLREPEVPAAERASALQRARAYWLLALGELDEPQRKPCLVLVGGLPGTGKSTLARGLADAHGFAVVRSDVVRKELARAELTLTGGLDRGIYSTEWNQRTYAECLRRAEELLFEGLRVIVDANFRAEDDRRAFLQAALQWGVPGVLLICRASPKVARERLDQRTNDASDADWSVHLLAASSWEAPGPDVQRHTFEIATDGPRADALATATMVLARQGLVGMT
jgi:aminoglycoside phosphotransferase family enzyme/predicted kinase